MADISRIKLPGQEALTVKAIHAALEGTPTAPTPPSSTNNTQIATTAFVNTNIKTAADALDERIDNLEQIGRFLALWNSGTGLPYTNPSSLPYTYKTGDYYRVSSLGAGGYNHQITITASSTTCVVNLNND